MPGIAEGVVFDGVMREVHASQPLVVKDSGAEQCHVPHLVVRQVQYLPRVTIYGLRCRV